MDSTSSFWLPSQSSTVAGQVDTLFDFILWVSVLLFVLVTGATIYFVIKYRRRGGESRTTPYVENLGLEITWTVLPTILIMIIFVWGFKDYLRLHIVPAHAIEVKVTGQKWFWSFSYPDGPTTVGELIVPANKPVKLLMSSQDVIHSFFVPSFRVKMDVLPNRYTITWFEATQIGEFQIFCTEFCGKGHSEMLAKVKVLPEEEYNLWLEKSSGPQEGETMEEYGARLFVKNACVTCHSLDGSRNVGPTFLGLFGRQEVMKDGQTIVVDENYLRESMLNPMSKIVQGYDPVMPTFQGILKDVDIDGLIAYIKSLEQSQ
jgi:cytochrome c oxidase subunit 2